MTRFENPNTGDYYIACIRDWDEHIMPSVMRSIIKGLGLDPGDFGFDLDAWYERETGKEEDDDD